MVLALWCFFLAAALSVVLGMIGVGGGLRRGT